MTLHKYIEAWIAFPDVDEKKFIISQEMREFLENHPSRKLYDDDYEDDDLFTIDIDEKTIKDMKKIAKTNDDKKLVHAVGAYEWVNVDIHVIFGR